MTLLNECYCVFGGLRELTEARGTTGLNGVLQLKFGKMYRHTFEHGGDTRYQYEAFGS